MRLSAIAVACKRLVISIRLWDSVAWWWEKRSHVRALLGDVEDECSGKLTLNLAHLQMDKQGVIDLDLRVPCILISICFNRGCSKRCRGWDGAIRSWPISTPLACVSHIASGYSVESGLSRYDRRATDTLGSSAVSYARSLPNCVPFGPYQPNIQWLPSKLTNMSL